MVDVPLSLVEATHNDASLLDNLLALYFYDFSEILGYDISASGSYNAAGWPWDDPSERIWLLSANALPAGFAITAPGSVIDSRPDVWDMREFFVLRRWRRAGLGRWLAQEVWQRQPATWDVRVIEPNTEALEFWRVAVSQAAGRVVEPELVTHPATGKPENLFRFEPRASSR